MDPNRYSGVLVIIIDVIAFHSLFGDPRWDPMRTGEGQADIIQSPALLYRTLNLFEQQAIGALSIFVRDAQAGTSCLIDGVSGYQDDIEDGIEEFILLNDNFFALTGPMFVLTGAVQHHKLAFESKPGLKVIPTKTAAFAVMDTPGDNFRAKRDLVRYMQEQVLYRNLPSLTNKKSPLDAWGQATVDKLSQLTRKTDQGKLPDLYNCWAGKKKHESLATIVDDCIQTAAGYFGVPYPVSMTTGTLHTPKSLHFYGCNKYGVADGLLPMAFVPPGTSKEQAVKEALEYQHHPKETIAFSTNKRYICTNWTEAIVQLRAYLPLLGALLGWQHPVVRYYAKGFPGPTVMVYLFQVQVCGWLEKQWNATEPLGDYPDFVSDLQAYMKACWKLHNNNNGNAYNVRNTKWDQSALNDGSTLSQQLVGKGPCFCDNRKDMCHTYHVKGQCSSACKLSYDRTTNLEEEYKRFRRSVQRARKLNTREFMEECDQVFMNEEHIKQHTYLMSHFAEEVTDLCSRLAPNPDQGTCRRSGFGSLDNSLKKAFFRQAVQHTNNNFPMDLVASWGDAGYIISDKTNIEKDVLRNDLCSEVFTSIGEDFIDHIPPSKLPITQSSTPPESSEPNKPNEPKRMSPPLPETSAIVGESNSGNNNDEPITIVQVEKEEKVLSVAAIISISCAVAALIVLFFYHEARRRKEARIAHYHSGSKGLEEDGVTQVSTYSGGRNTSPFKSFTKSNTKSANSTSTPADEIKAAINNADWDSVYKLASQIAENDDGLSTRFGSFKTQNRSHLGAEDQERTMTLDELASNGDWTGLAVTAALYAGETSGTSHDDAEYSANVNSSTGVSLSPSQSQDVEEGHATMEQMVNGLSVALNAGKWSEVSKYANLIKDEKNAGSSFDTDSQVVMSSSSSIASIDTNNTEVSKKQTIEKLMRAGKWKGVSIMANMYEMESKNRGSPTPIRPYPTSPSHPYTDRRSIVGTRELQHEDRLQENIVSFRRDP
eukprot:jgi/Psemu1/62571/estExt_Genemark1.C_40209